MAAKAIKAKKSTQRKLTAILCADVVDYSRLMGADEEATVATLGAYRKVFTEQEYFSDGITEDLITDLSRLPSD